MLPSPQKKHAVRPPFTIRPPVVAIMGHVDHGKSSLLDFIRKSNIVALEVGGITQSVSAYEIWHKDEHGNPSAITFIDTPGHAAFPGMRSRSANIADIAILIISAEEGVKAQTIEALNTIIEAKIPFVVALNKIDRPGADCGKVSNTLMEHDVYLEGYGGSISCAKISARTGEGINDLLDMILLVASMEEFTWSDTASGSGFVIESHLDPQRGITGTLIVKNGVIEGGDYLVVGESYATTRIMEDSYGNQLKNAYPCLPITVTGFSRLPSIGENFITAKTKKEAEEIISLYKLEEEKKSLKHIIDDNEKRLIIPVIIKADVAGMTEAIASEVTKLSDDRVLYKIIDASVGTISERDIKLSENDSHSIILGFNVGLDKIAQEARNNGRTIEIFSIIYKLSEWLLLKRAELRPKFETEKIIARGKILKVFSSQKQSHLIGIIHEIGTFTLDKRTRIHKREGTIENGTISLMKQGGVETKEVREGDFGAMFESKGTPDIGDTIEIFETVME